MQRPSAYQSLDLFRGFAAIWVVLRHCTDRWIGDGHFAYLHQPLYAFSIRGQNGVIIFFVISGYCIMAAAHSALISQKPVWRYGFDRIRRIYPPYLAAFAVAFLSVLLLGFASSHHLIPPIHHGHKFPSDWRYWFANVFLLQGEFGADSFEVVFWSLTYEVAFYGIVGLFLAVAKYRLAKTDLINGTLVLVLLNAILSIVSIALQVAGYHLIFPFDYWYLFGIGAALYSYLEIKPQSHGADSVRLRRYAIVTAILIAAMSIVFACLQNFPGNALGIPSSRTKTITALLFSILLLVLRPIDKRIAGSAWVHPLMRVGAFSYSLYLIHNVALPYVDVLSRKAGLNEGRYWIAVVLQLAVALVVGRLFYVVVEKHFISKRQITRLQAEHVV